MGRVYACSDLHGMYDLYHQIKEFLQPDDRVYFLGDAGDRGKECWKTVKAILSDPQFFCLKGNHEDMLVSVMQDEMTYGRLDYNNLSLLYQNGGNSTYEGWNEEDRNQQAYWFYKIKKLPYEVKYVNKDNKKIFLSHAGFTPQWDRLEWHGWQQDLIWDRRHLTDPWSRKNPKDWYIIHGHTPIPYVVDELQWKDRDLKRPRLPVAYWYADGHKCCIDCGSFFTYCTVLLDLDTFEEHYFMTDGYGGENG